MTLIVWHYLEETHALPIQHCWYWILAYGICWKMAYFPKARHAATMTPILKIMWGRSEVSFRRYNKNSPMLQLVRSLWRPLMFIVPPVEQRHAIRASSTWATLVPASSTRGSWNCSGGNFRMYGLWICTNWRIIGPTCPYLETGGTTNAPAKMLQCAKKCGTGPLETLVGALQWEEWSRCVAKAMYPRRSRSHEWNGVIRKILIPRLAIMKVLCKLA